MKNTANCQEYIVKWIRENPENYETLKNKCFMLALQTKDDISIKNVICSLRLEFPNFKFRDGAARLMAEHLSNEYILLRNRFTKSKKVKSVK